MHFGVTHRHTVYWTNRPNSEIDNTTPAELNHGFQGQVAEDFKKLIQRFPAVFSKRGRNEGTRTIQHTIRLHHQQPIRSPPYRVSDEKKKIIQEQVQEMLKEGVITPSTSQYASPVVLVPKKDNTLRFCVDYRRINDATMSEPTPMPIISETLRDLGAARVFSSLDLKSGYWQIRMEEGSKAATAFTTPDGGHYEFEVMPFGLKNAPATFQRMMSQEVLVGLLRDCCMVYLDDIIVYSRNQEEHLRHLALVFERLQEHGLRLAANKCEFGKTNIPYLGHLIVDDTTQPMGKHIRGITEFATPRCKKDLRSFLGLCNWVRDYVPRFAELSAPITDLLANNKQFKWTPSAEAAFQAVKQAFTTPLQLHRPIPDAPYVLQTDASGIGIAAVLYQPTEDSKRIVTYASARLTKTEARYHVNEQECLALVWAIRRFRPLLEGRSFTVRTDSKALTWLQRFKDTKAKLLRWALLLQEFDFVIEHCPGKDNELADALSRNPDDDVGTDEDYSRLLPPAADGIHAVLDTPLPELIKRQHAADPFVKRIITRIKDPADPDAATLNGQLEVTDGILWKKATANTPRTLYVSRSLRRRVLQMLHDEAGHPGRDETIHATMNRYYWPEQKKEIVNYVRRCATCAAVKPGARRKPAPLKPRTPTEPWHTISVDLMGPYPKTSAGKTGILVVTDSFTRWVEAFAIGDSRAGPIIRLMEENVFNRFGYPSVVISDNGTQFTSQKWKEACKKWGAKTCYTAVYHPRANPTERRNQEIKKGLRVRLQGKPHTRWAKLLPEVLRDLRCRRNAATGFSPSQALLGYQLRLPGDRQLNPELQVEAPHHPNREARLEDIREHQLSYQRRYDGGEAMEELQVGDNVFIRNHQQSNARGRICKGFLPTWLGPYPIRKLHAGRVYTIDKDGAEVRVPAQDIKPAAPPPEADREPPLPAPTDDGSSSSSEDEG